MKSLKNQYNYDPTAPLSKPYNDTQIFNAYYKGYDSVNNFHVLISHYKTMKQSQISSYTKKYNKLKGITHKNLCKIYDVIGQKTQLFIVQEWCQGGNIVDYIGKQYTLDWRLAIRIIFSVLTGLTELHKAQHTHNFINLQNIEIDQNGTPKLSYKCIIYKTFYLAPQVKKNHQKTKQNDFFALGVSLYRLIYGVLPFKQNKTQDFINSVKNGPDLHPANSNNTNQLFPLCVPIQIQQIIKQMLSVNPQTRFGCFGKMKNYPSQKVDTILSKQVYKKVLNNKYINIYTLKDTMEEQCFTVLQSKQKRLLKINVIQSGKAQIDKYVQKVLKKLMNHPHQAFLNIYDYQIINQQYLSIIYSYDNQGSLLKYRQNMESKQGFSQKMITVTVNSLIAAISKFPNRYQYLTNESIFIKSGFIRIRHPQFPTRQYLYSFKQLKSNECSFIAPQVIENKPSQVCDSWSIGVIQYWMSFNKMPIFDPTGTLILPNRQFLPKQVIIHFNELIQQNPKQRKNILIEDKSKIKKPRKPSSRQSDNIRTSQLNNNQNIISPPQVGNSNINNTNTNNRSFMPNANQSSNIQNNLQKNRFMSEQFDIIDFSPVKSPKMEKKHTSFKQPQKKESFVFELLSGYSNKTNYLQRSWTKPIRILLKCLVCIIFYLFLYYYNFFYINGTLLGSRYSYAVTQVQIRAFPSDATPNINYTLVTQTPFSTNTTFYNTTLGVLRDDYQCVLNDYSVQSDVLGIIQSPGFAAYQVFGFLFGVFNIILACLILAKLDFCKALYLTKFQDKNFIGIYSWIFVNLAISSLTSCMYLIYGGLYDLMLTPCLGKAYLPALQYIMKNWIPSFAWRFCWVYLGIFVAYVVIFYFLLRPNTKVHKYVYYILLFLYFLGIGSRFMGKVVNEKQCAFGVCGELLALLVGVLAFIIDLVFNCFIARRGTKNVNDVDSIEEQANKTHEYLYNDDEK